MEIYNILFEALSQFGKDYMVLKLYDIILKQHLNPSYKVHSIVMKIVQGFLVNLHQWFLLIVKTIISRKNIK